MTDTVIECASCKQSHGDWCFCETCEHVVCASCAVSSDQCKVCTSADIKDDKNEQNEKSGKNQTSEKIKVRPVPKYKLITFKSDDELKIGMSVYTLRQTNDLKVPGQYETTTILDRPTGDTCRSANGESGRPEHFYRLRTEKDLVFTPEYELRGADGHLNDHDESADDDDNSQLSPGDYVAIRFKRKFLEVQLLDCLSAVRGTRWTCVDGSGKVRVITTGVMYHKKKDDDKSDDEDKDEDEEKHNVDKVYEKENDKVEKDTVVIGPVSSASPGSPVKKRESSPTKISESAQPSKKKVKV